MVTKIRKHAILKRHLAEWTNVFAGSWQELWYKSVVAGQAQAERRASFKLVQIGVGCGMAQGTAHGDDLTFVMEGVGKDVMEDERRGTNGSVSIGEMQFRIYVELLVGQAWQIGEGVRADPTLQDSGIGDVRPVGGDLILEADGLESVDPECFAVEDMNYLSTERREAEARKFFRIITFGYCREMIERKSEAAVCPAVQLTDAGESEQVEPPCSSDLL